MANGRRRSDGRKELPPEMGDGFDEDALVTMVDQPVMSFVDDEDDSDLASTQLEWVSPLDPRFTEHAPERFPADEPEDKQAKPWKNLNSSPPKRHGGPDGPGVSSEPLAPPRRLEPDFNSRPGLPEETDPTLLRVPEAEETALREPPPRVRAESEGFDSSVGAPDAQNPQATLWAAPNRSAAKPHTSPDSLQSQELDMSDLVPVLEAPSPAALRTPPGSQSLRTSNPHGVAAQIDYEPTRLAVPDLRRRLSRTAPPSRTDPTPALRLLTAGLVVGVFVALLVVALAAGVWYAAG